MHPGNDRSDVHAQSSADFQQGILVHDARLAHIGRPIVRPLVDADAFPTDVGEVAPHRVVVLRAQITVQQVRVRALVRGSCVLVAACINKIITLSNFIN